MNIISRDFAKRIDLYDVLERVGLCSGFITSKIGLPQTNGMVAVSILPTLAGVHLGVKG
jgi:hypothetical protein